MKLPLAVLAPAASLSQGAGLEQRNGLITAETHNVASKSNAQPAMVASGPTLSQEVPNTE